MKNHLLFLFLFCTICSYTQSDSTDITSFHPKQQIFRSWGFSTVLTNFHVGKATEESGFQLAGMSLFNYYYTVRKNILNFGSNGSISIEASPSIKATIYGRHNYNIGFGSTHIPLLISLNYGNASTWESIMEEGYTMAAGIDLNYTGFYLHQLEDWIKYERLFLQYHFKIGYRYWGRKKKVKELSLNLGLGVDKFKWTGENGSTFRDRSISAEIIWTTYLNY